MRRLLFFALPLALAACDSPSTCDGPGCGGGPPQDDIVAGVNLTRLFATATPAELAAVRAEWSSRDATRAGRYTVALVDTLTGEDGAPLHVYEGRDAASGAVLFHGVVRLPIRAPGDVRRRPLVLVLPDGDEGTGPDLLEALPILPTEREEYAYAVLAYRGEPLRAGGQTFGSSAPPRPYDLDTDDAHAFVDAVRVREPEVFPDRVAVIGFGRGGTVALLAVERAHPFDLAVSLGAPTSFFLSSVRFPSRQWLLGQGPIRLPAFPTVAAQVLGPLRDSAITYDQARLDLLRRSPAPFVTPPPFLILAHGVLDNVVPVEHGRAVRGILGTGEGVYLEREEDDHTSISFSSEVVLLVSTELRERLGG